MKQRLNRNQLKIVFLLMGFNVGILTALGIAALIII